MRIWLYTLKIRIAIVPFYLTHVYIAKCAHAPMRHSKLVWTRAVVSQLRNTTAALMLSPLQIFPPRGQSNAVGWAKNYLYDYGSIYTRKSIATTSKHLNTAFLARRLLLLNMCNASFVFRDWMVMSFCRFDDDFMFITAFFGLMEGHVYCLFAK